MKGLLLRCTLIFITSFVLYFGFGTRWTGEIRQELDHYNSLAHSLREGHLDIRNTPVTDELSFYNGKWYPYYGPLPAVFIGLLQIISGKAFIPTLYPQAFVASLGVVVTYLLILLFKRTYYPQSAFSPLVPTVLVAFGSVFFWLATHSGVWFQAQIYSYLITSIGFLPLIRAVRTPIRYSLSAFILSLNLFTRPHTVLLLIVPLVFYFFDTFDGAKLRTLARSKTRRSVSTSSSLSGSTEPFGSELRAELLTVEVLGVEDLSVPRSSDRRVEWVDQRRRINLWTFFKVFYPVVFSIGVFSFYNYARFGNLFETGVSYQHFHYQFAHRYAIAGGWFNPINIPYNLWFMTLEIPRLTWEHGFTNLSKIRLETNPEGNSIFFLTPPLLWIFFALPWKQRKATLKRLSWILWGASIMTIIPVLLLTGTGWQQFGYRYILDIMVPLVLLVIIGLNGATSKLFYLGLLVSVFFNVLGVNG